MSLRIGGEAPDFTADTTEGTIRFHEWIGNPQLKIAKLYDMSSSDPIGPQPR